MKRIHILCTLALILMLFSGCAQRQSQMTYIGAEEAKRLALDAAGLTAAGVESSSTDLNTRNGLDYYQVEFTAGGQDYQYDIDALTGVVIESRSPAMPDDSLVTDADTYNTDLSAAQETQSPAPNGTAGEPITADETKSAALAHAGLTHEQVIFVKAKLDYEDGRQVYEVEFYTQGYKEYDYEINAYTVNILSYDYDAEDYTAPSSGGTITAEKAKELALAQVPGAAASDIREFETEYDDGRTEYEGTIVYNGMEYEFEIDAYTGAVFSKEAESIYD